MEGDQLALRFAFLFLPGIVALLMVDALIVHRRWEQFEQLMYAFALGVFSYVVAELIHPDRLAFWAELDSTATNSINAIEVGFVTLVSVVIGALISLAINRKWLSTVAGWLKISQKYGDENLFYFALGSDTTRWVDVRLPEQNLVYQGAVVSLSSDEESREIVLRDVEVYSSKKGKLLYHLDSAYLSLPHQGVIIEMRASKRCNKEER